MTNKGGTLGNVPAIFFLSLFFLLGKPATAFCWVTNQSADYVVGQANMTGASSRIYTAYSLYYPFFTYTDGTKLYIADYANNRVLIYNSIPTQNNASADVVVGQTDMVSVGAGTTAYGLYNPGGVYTDGTKLYISEYNNHRVLIYNSIPTQDNASADVVVGQTNMTSADYGSTAYNLFYPTRVYTDGTKLYIADSSNNRVLIYNSIPTQNNASADVVVGQTDMVSYGDQAPLGANMLNYPITAYSDGSKFYVADATNNRVLIYNSIPTQNNASADIVIGQTDMVSVSPGTTAYGLYNPWGLHSDGTKLYVADTSNNRVLIYNTIPTQDNASADVVVGQTDMISADIGTTAYGLYGTEYLYSDGTKLYVVDNDNHRVLIYNSIPTQNNASADVVVGQTDMISGSYGTTAYTLYYPEGVYSDGTKLYIAEYGNARVLIYNSIPTQNNASADIVLGQTDMISAVSGTSAYGFSWAGRVYSDGSKLYISEFNNYRVLIYNSIPTQNNASADVVVGQTDMTSESFGTTAYELGWPWGVYSDGTKLYIADAGNRRVLIYNAIPTQNNASADVVIGHTDMVSDRNITAYTLDYPTGVSSDGTKLYISDTTNYRVLIYNSIPTQNNASADVVVGQTDMTTAAAGTTAYGFSSSYMVYTDGTKLYVADQSNNRVLIYNSIPTENNASADVVIGQTDMVSSGAGTTAYGLTTPISAYTDGTKLYLTDYANHRILIYNSIPTQNNASADVVVGQTDMTSAVTTYAQGYILYGPTNVYTDGTKLYIADTTNNRVLIYNSIPAANNVSADVVVGQTDMVSSNAGTTAYGLYAPYSVYADGTKLYIADTTNNRVLIYNAIPTQNNVSADVVVGQTDMISAGAGTSASALYSPIAYTDGTKLYIADYSNNRVLIYNSIPTQNNASADVVVGQADMAGASAGTTAYGLYNPSGAYTDGTKLYIADYSNNRVLIYNNIPTENNASADVVVGQADMASASAGTTAYGLTNPRNTYSDGTKLYIVDRSNNRILIYNAIPTQNNASADVVIGQTDMVSGVSARTAYNLYIPLAVYSDGTKLYVADNNNYRVLIYVPHGIGFQRLRIEGIRVD